MKNLDKLLEYGKNYYWDNRDRLRNYTKEWRMSNMSGIRHYDLMKLYGINNDEYNSMFNSQNGCCAICGIHQSELKKRLSVDHDHITGVVRGLLCDRHNRGMGYFSESPELLRKTADYLEKFIPPSGLI